MKIKYDFFKEAMQGKYNKYHILNATNVWNDLPSYQNCCFRSYLVLVFFFFFTISIQKQRIGPWLGYKTTKVTCQCKEDSSMRLIHKDHILCLILSFFIETDCLSVLFWFKKLLTILTILTALQVSSFSEQHIFEQGWTHISILSVGWCLLCFCNA